MPNNYAEIRRLDNERHRERYGKDIEESRRKLRDRYYKNLEKSRRRNRECAARYRARKKEYANKHPEMIRLSAARYAKNNPEKIAAQRLAQYHIKLNGPCEICGEPAAIRHHPDYSQPLLIIRLCMKCHRDIHRRTA